MKVPASLLMFGTADTPFASKEETTRFLASCKFRQQHTAHRFSHAGCVVDIWPFRGGYAVVKVEVTDIPIDDENDGDENDDDEDTSALCEELAGD